MPSGNQFGRKIGLLVGGSGSNALDLSSLEISFRINQADWNAPSTAYIRVFNPAQSTVASIQAEFSTVALQAGYQNGNFAIIFSGTIMQVRTGKMDSVTRFLDIRAADGDLFHNYGIVNSVLQPGASNSSQLSALKSTLNNNGISIDPNANQPLSQSGGIYPRGKVLIGLGKAYMNNAADAATATWFIEQGVLKIVPLTGVLPGTAVAINSKTGLVGVPEATENGIYVRTLLNPLIKVGTAVQLDNDEITRTSPNISKGFPTFQSKAFFASLSPTGKYRVVVAEHHGGIRENPWYTDLVVLAIDQTSNKVAIAP
jgi:hypothetical protein